MDILEQVLRLVERYASRPFLIDGLNDRVYTYGEVHRLACNLAVELHTRGIRHGDRVALVSRNSVEFALLYFGCLYLGAVVLPVNPRLHKREIEFILQQCGVKLVIHSPATSDLFDHSALAGQGVRLWSVLPAGELNQTRREDVDAWSVARPPATPPNGWQPFTGVSPNDLFSITVTSGTTGVSKVVAHRISDLLGNAIAFNDELGFGPGNRFLHVFPMAYMAGFLNTLLCPFMAGSSAVLTRAFDAQTVLRFWQPVIRHRANTFWLAPTMLMALLSVDRDPAGLEYCRKHVKTVCVGTAPLPLKLKKAFERKYGVELFESYGLSELLLVSANSNHFPRVDGSAGRLLPEIEIRVVNERGEPVGLGEDGEICIKTPYIMAGYLNHQTLQMDAINPADWFPTGDIGHVSTDGHLFITGRMKDLIIRGGINISPQAVEEVLMEHEAIAQVAVIGLPHEFYGEEVVAVVRLKRGYNLSEQRASLEELCKKRLSAVSVPTLFIEMERLPLSVTGKVLKNKLRERFLTGTAGAVEVTGLQLNEGGVPSLAEK